MISFKEYRIDEQSPGQDKKDKTNPNLPKPSSVDPNFAAELANVERYLIGSINSQLDDLKAKLTTHFNSQFQEPQQKDGLWTRFKNGTRRALGTWLSGGVPPNESNSEELPIDIALFGEMKLVKEFQDIMEGSMVETLSQALALVDQTKAYLFKIVRTSLSYLASKPRAKTPEVAPIPKKQLRKPNPEDLGRISASTNSKPSSPFNYDNKSSTWANNPFNYDKPIITSPGTRDYEKDAESEPVAASPEVKAKKTDTDTKQQIRQAKKAKGVSAGDEVVPPETATAPETIPPTSDEVKPEQPTSTPASDEVNPKTTRRGRPVGRVSMSEKPQSIDDDLGQEEEQKHQTALSLDSITPEVRSLYDNTKNPAIKRGMVNYIKQIGAEGLEKMKNGGFLENSLKWLVQRKGLFKPIYWSVVGGALQDMKIANLKELSDQHKFEEFAAKVIDDYKKRYPEKNESIFSKKTLFVERLRKQRQES